MVLLGQGVRCFGAFYGFFLVLPVGKGLLWRTSPLLEGVMIKNVPCDLPQNGSRR